MDFRGNPLLLFQMTFPIYFIMKHHSSVIRVRSQEKENTWNWCAVHCSVDTPSLTARGRSRVFRNTSSRDNWDKEWTTSVAAQAIINSALLKF